jgi:PAS domain S-box-containing protein
VAAYVPKADPDAPERVLDAVERHTTTEIAGSAEDLPSPTADTIIRAVDEAPVGITLSDPSLPDNPLVYVNEAYEGLTGYAAADVLGRNCRFLQGPDTDEEPVREMREAIENDEPVSVELLNYREDGTPFWNQVTIAPIYDGDGDVSHYVGFQNNVTDRKEAEAMAKQRADSLREERQALERVLGRVSGLVNDVSHVLVNAESREEIERQVCDEITAIDGYSHAWIGDSMTSGMGLRVRVGAGTAGQALERASEVEWSGSILAQAVEQGQVSVYDGTDDLPAAIAPEAFDAASVAVVPLTYRRTTYGVLVVYAERSGVLDRRECKVFEALGGMIASGINAVETKRVLTADRVTELGFEITDESFPLIELATVANGSVTYNGSTAGDGNSLRMFVTVSGSDESLADIMDRCRAISNGYVIARQDGTIAASIELAGATIFQDLAEYGATVRELTVSGDSGTAQLYVELPVEGDVRSVVSVLESTYDGVSLVRQRERERSPRPTAEFTATVIERLTDRQYTALETAYMSNYFEFPRPVSGEELAESMGISRQTYHQHLRAAQRKLLEEFFEPDS